MNDTEMDGKISVNLWRVGVNNQKNAVVSPEEICYNIVYYGKFDLFSKRKDGMAHATGKEEFPQTG